MRLKPLLSKDRCPWHISLNRILDYVSPKIVSHRTQFTKGAETED